VWANATSAQCMCPLGFERQSALSESVSYEVCKDKCEDYCMNGTGTCTKELDGTPTCSCNWPFSGSKCSQDSCKNFCRNGGKLELCVILLFCCDSYNGSCIYFTPKHFVDL